jgi:hypothetical protein
LPLAGFDGARNEKPPLVLHEIVEEDKGPQLAFEGFKSHSPVNIKGAKVSHFQFACDFQFERCPLLGRIISKLITCCLQCLT